MELPSQSLDVTAKDILSGLKSPLLNPCEDCKDLKLEGTPKRKLDFVEILSLEFSRQMFNYCPKAQLVQLEEFN